jgi:hypothetical protein
MLPFVDTDAPKLFLPQHRVIVVAFKMQGCGACAEYIPRFTKAVTAKGLPVFNVSKDSLPSAAELAATCLPVYVIDCEDEKFAAWCDHLAVKKKDQGMPATYVVRRPHGKIAIEGAIPNGQIEWLLGKALRGLSCDLDR